ncbi:MAG: hypothetical protein ACRDFB_08025, partial [Rhabdochlamydiaceae bacterium]
NYMGEIADMLLEGVLCEGCGEALFDNNGEPKSGDGIPDYCSPQCAIDRGAYWWLETNGYDKNGRKLRK